MKKFIGAVCATAALFLSASVANAATVYQTTFQGATFTVTQNSSTNLTFDSAGANALTGNWAGAQFLGALSFKGLGATALTATLAGGGSTNAISGGLAAGGCNGNGDGFVCFDFAPNIAANTSNLTFDINATSGAFDIASGGPHLKILWSKNGTTDQKIGDLFSQDIPFSHETTTAVPEPATWAMMIMGFGLAGAAMRRRRGALAVA